MCARFVKTGMKTVCDADYTKVPNKCCGRKNNVYVPCVVDVKMSKNVQHPNNMRIYK